MAPVLGGWPSGAGSPSRGGRPPAPVDGAPGEAGPAPQFSTGAAVPLGSRLWLYSNFHCNLACTYCCSQSSPQAAARLLPVELARDAVTEFVALGGRELLITGGEPFLHPRLGEIVADAAARLPVVILTNAMVFARGARRATLEAMSRDGVTLQVSLDSAGATLHDRQRGAGSHARALAGIELARGLGFRVRVAATLHDEDLESAPALHAKLDELEVRQEDRLIRPVAQEGFAEAGVRISLDTVEPEPTLTVDGAWWHPVAVTSDNLRVAPAPLPLAHVLDVMRDVLAVQAASSAEGRAVFRCT
jgi:organic radical activating enzyme